MPKLIDWAARYDLMREAIVRIAARDGACALSLVSVAAELKVHHATVRRAIESPDVLPGMGIAWIATRRSRRMVVSRSRDHEYGSIEHIVGALQCALPLRDEDLEDERGWRALTVSGMDEVSARIARTQDEHLDGLLRQILVTLGTEPDSRAQQQVSLRALVEGLVAALCRSSITHEQAIECLEVHVRGLPCVPELRVTIPPGVIINPVVGGAPR